LFFPFWGAYAPLLAVGLFGPDTVEVAANERFNCHRFLRVLDLLKQALLYAVLFELDEVTGGNIALALE
tara:strand:+ start:663 stop:869 length:207 start_codon:yes stop_codon:yes gene_type:complete